MTTHYFRARAILSVGHKLILALATLIALTVSARIHAGGSLGLDYFSSQLTVSGIRNQIAEQESDGPGVSFSWNFSDAWSAQISHSRSDGETNRFAGELEAYRIAVDAESNTTSLGLTRNLENGWLNLNFSTTEDEQVVRGRFVATDTLSLDIDEQQDAQALSIELGRDWMVGNWSPALSASISHQRVDFNRIERLDTQELSNRQGIQETLTGTDLGLSATLFYFQALSPSMTLTPALGLFYQTNLDGDISGIAGFSRQGATDSFQTSGDYRGDLDTDDEITANVALNLSTGDWLWSIGYLTSLSSEASSDAFFAGINYRF